MNMKLNRSRGPALAGAAIALSLVCGCHKKQGPDPNSMGPVTAPVTSPAPTASLTADPVAIDLGQSVVLNWRSTNANVVTIDGIGQVNANGTQTVAPSNSTNFHLIAKGDGGSTEANVRVTVNVPVAPTPPPADTTMNYDETSDSAFHKAVADVYFDYDSYDPGARCPQFSLPGRQLPERASECESGHRRLLRRPRISGVQPCARRKSCQLRQVRRSSPLAYPRAASGS